MGMLGSQNSLLCIALKENPTGKRPLGKTMFEREDLVRKDMEMLGMDWKILASYREN